VDGPAATVTFSALAGTGRTSPAWDRATATCTGVTCHGAGLASSAGAAPRWTYVVAPDPGRPQAEICGSCHAARPALPHPQLGPCAACHPATVRPDGTIDVAGGKHIDGEVEEDAASAACGACHAIPGESGAHAAHVASGPGVPQPLYGDVRAWADFPVADVNGYLFGCGLCHPLDEARHMDGLVQVEVGPEGAPAGSLRSRNAAAAAYLADGTCSGVYCHSSGQAAPAFVTTPGWRSGATLGCNGCHANPPRYPSGPAGSDTANTHLVARSTVYTDPVTRVSTTYTGGYGHFAWHSRTHAAYTQPTTGQHGSFGAAPMTCQACHADTVDPTSTGPSGAWWLDTTGDYLVPGQNYAGYTCTTSGCHDDQPGFAPSGRGRVRPWRHVNGSRDVVFDARTAAPPYGLPAAPATPDYPYWVTVVAFADSASLQPGSAFAPPPPPTGPAAGTISFRLDGASYDPVTRTCSSVACHLKQASVAWGGAAVGTYSTCFNCHASH
jgi:predicted CxxxxCH...CXXCH cytochrome family protein